MANPTTTTPAAPPAQSTSKRAASQISGGAPDDRGQTADGTTTTNASGQQAAVGTTAINASGQQAAVGTTAISKAKAKSTKTIQKAKDYTQFLEDNYKNRDDIEITPAEMEVKCCVGSTSRLKSICNVDPNTLPIKALRVIFQREQLTHFNGKTKKQICDIIVAVKINTKAYQGSSSGVDATTVSDKGTPKQRINSFFRLVNVLHDPDVKKLYADFGKQPTAADLTAGRAANQKLFETIVTVFNNKCNDDDDSILADDDEDPLGSLIYNHDQFEGVDPSNFVPFDSWRQVVVMHGR
jgi:hypothetical protein